MRACDSQDLSTQKGASFYPTIPTFNSLLFNTLPSSTSRSHANTPPGTETAASATQAEVNLIDFSDNEDLSCIKQWEEFDPLSNNNDNVPLVDSFMNVFDRIYDPIYPPLPRNDLTLLDSDCPPLVYNQSSSPYPILSPPPFQGQPNARNLMRTSTLPSFNHTTQMPSTNTLPNKSNNLSLERILSREEKFLLIDSPEEKELEHFVDMVSRVRACYQISNSDNDNSHASLFNSRVQYNQNNLFVGFLPQMTVEIRCDDARHENPFRKECDVNDMTPEVLINAALVDFFDTTNSCDYYLRIHGRLEYLENSRKLSEHTHIIQCCRYERPLKLILEHKDKVSRQFKRLVEEASIPFTAEEATRANTKQFLSKDELQNLLIHLLLKINDLEKLTVHVEVSVRIQVLMKLVSSILDFSRRLEKVIPEELMQLINDLEETLRWQYQVSSNMTHVLHTSTMRVCQQFSNMVRCYCRLKRTPYTLPQWSSCRDPPQASRPSEEVKELFRVRILSLHRYKTQPSERSDKIHVEVSLFFAGRQLHLQPENVTCPWYATMPLETKTVRKSLVLPPILSANQWIYFNDASGRGGNFTINRLPRETMLRVHVLKENPISSPTPGNTAVERDLIGWAQMPIFDVDYQLCQGPYWLGLWPESKSEGDEMAYTTNRDNSCPILLIHFDEFPFQCVFPPPPPDPQLNIAFGEFVNLSEDVQVQLLQYVRMAWFLQDTEFIKASLNAEDNDCEMQNFEPLAANLLWEHRTRLMNKRRALISLILIFTNTKPDVVVKEGWTMSQFMSHIYSLMKLWKWPHPVMALRLLCLDVPDIQIRRQARKWLARASPEDLIIHLPEIIQCVKSDIHLDWSGLCELLLELSMDSIHFANALYWQLKECHVNSCHSLGLQTLFAALLRCCDGLRNTWREQEAVIEKLAIAATNVKNVKSKDRATKEKALEEGIGAVYDLMKTRSSRESNTAFRLPYDLGVAVCQVDVKTCSVFPSFTQPLRIAFSNFDSSAATVEVMFKSGDDLRQDRFITSMIMLMDRIWLQKGLDLKLIHYRVLSTSNTKGFVELVTECCTLRQIQESEASILGAAFDEKCIVSWLRKQCPNEEQYLKAVESFLYSSAGCCVATYLLGVGDRHNDNIMLKTTGHMFHIDFSKILGDFQKFAGVNRDRVPFVFTPAMVYVLQSYECPTSKSTGRGIQVFFETCCKAYNVLRKKFYQLFTILQLAATSGIPGVDQRSIQYFMRALQIRLTEMEATTSFTRDLQKALSSKFPQINHLIHSLAAGKMSSQAEGALFRFTSKTNSMRMDGKISRIEIEKYQHGRPNGGWPVYVYRDHFRKPSIAWRSLNDFKELARILYAKFQLEPTLLRITEMIGKCSETELDAANTRECLQKVVNALLTMAPEISECDIIYTFFHTTSTGETGRRRSRNDELAPIASLMAPMEVQIDIEMSRNKQCLYLFIKGANNVRLPSNETPNVYVKCYLRPPLNYPPKKKTQAVTGANPVFNDTLTYSFPPGEDYRRHKLLISLWQYRGVGRNEGLGEVCIDLSTVRHGSMESRTLKMVSFTVSTLPLRPPNRQELATRSLPPIPGSGWNT